MYITGSGPGVHLYLVICIVLDEIVGKINGRWPTVIKLWYINYIARMCFLPVITVRPKQVQQITVSIAAVLAVVLVVSVEEGSVTGV